MVVFAHAIALFLGWKMKRTTLSAAALLALASPALAGGPTIVEPDPVPTVMPEPAATTDWSGLYAGLSYGRSSGDLDFDPVPAQSLDSGNATALYLGYLWQRNNLVYGGELAYTRLKDNFVTGFTCCEVDRSIDLKGRVGMAANRVLFYGVLGYSMSSYDEGSGNWDPSGLSYGLGVDFRATQRLNIGLEYLARDLNGDNPNGLGQEVNIDLDTVSLRVGLSF